MDLGQIEPLLQSMLPWVASRGLFIQRDHFAPAALRFQLATLAEHRVDFRHGLRNADADLAERGRGQERQRDNDESKKSAVRRVPNACHGSSCGGGAQTGEIDANLGRHPGESLDMHVLHAPSSVVLFKRRANTGVPSRLSATCAGQSVPTPQFGPWLGQN